MRRRLHRLALAANLFAGAAGPGPATVKWDSTFSTFGWMLYSDSDFSVASQINSQQTTVANITFDPSDGVGRYWEIRCDIISVSSGMVIGLSESSNLNNDYLGNTHGWGYYTFNGNLIHGGGATAYSFPLATQDILSVWSKNGKMWFGKNGVPCGVGDPVAGTGEAFSGMSGMCQPAISFIDTTAGGPKFSLRATVDTCHFYPQTGFDYLDPGTRSKTFTGILDAYLTDIDFAHGVINTVGAYTGPAMQVYRASDGTFHDIPFGPRGRLDGYELWKQIGLGTQGFITKLYDHTGQGNHFTTNTPNSGPYIWDNGTMYVGARINAVHSAENFLADNSSPASTNKAVLMWYSMRSLGALINEYGHGEVIGHATLAEQTYQTYVISNSNTHHYIGNDVVSGNADYTEWISSENANGGHYLTNLLGTTTGVGQISKFYEGTNVTPGSASSVGIGSSHNAWGSKKWRMGGRSDNALPPQFDMYVNAAWNVDQSANGAALTLPTGTPWDN